MDWLFAIGQVVSVVALLAGAGFSIFAMLTDPSGRARDDRRLVE